MSHLTVRSDRVRYSLPFVWSIFSEFAWFFHNRFLGRTRMRQRVSELDSRKQ